MPIPESASCWGKSSSADWQSWGWSGWLRSSAVPFAIIQEAAEFFDLFPRSLAAGERVHHELACRSLEYALQHVSGELPLGLLGRKTCFIDVRTLGFVSANDTFCCHDLQQLQHGGVSQSPFLAKRFVHFPHGGGAAAP